MHQENYSVHFVINIFMPGVKGVSWSSEQKRWKTQISFNGKRKYLGTFKVLSDAEEFVNLARDMIHGEFARVA